MLPFPLRSETKLIIIVYLSQDFKNTTLLLGWERGEFQKELGGLDVLFPWVALQTSAQHPDLFLFYYIRGFCLSNENSCHQQAATQEAQEELWWSSKRSCNLLWFALLLTLMITVAISDGEINHVDQRQP